MYGGCAYVDWEVNIVVLEGLGYLISPFYGKSPLFLCTASLCLMKMATVFANFCTLAKLGSVQSTPAFIFSKPALSANSNLEVANSPVA